MGGEGGASETGEIIPRRGLNRGFTLIELMITIAVDFQGFFVQKVLLDVFAGLF